jgi:hypothetical protein
MLAAALCLGAVFPYAGAQQAQQQATPKEQMFSGEVTEIDSSSLTATRTGSKDSKTFLITAETKFEGKPKAKSRVTIRWVATDDGAKALRVIVKTAAKK